MSRRRNVHFQLPSREQQVVRRLKAEVRDTCALIRDQRKILIDVAPSQFFKDVEVIKSVNLNVKKELQHKFEKILSLQWSGDTAPSRKLVVLTDAGKLIVWNTAKQTKSVTFKVVPRWLICCDYSPSGNFIAAGGETTECLIYKIRGRNKSYRRPLIFDGHTSYVSGCRFLSDTHLITASCDSTCGIWDIETGQKISTFAGHSKEITCLGAARNTTLFVTGSDDCTVKTWDSRDFRFSQTFYGHIYDINCVEFFPGNTAFATASEDTTSKFFDLRSDNEMICFKSSKVKGALSSISFSSSGRLMFSASEDSNCYIWDTLKAEVVGKLLSHSGVVSSVGVSYDGVVVATGSFDSTVKIWQ